MMQSENPIFDEFSSFLAEQSDVNPNSIFFRIHWVKQFLEGKTNYGPFKKKEIDEFIEGLRKKKNIEEWQFKQAIHTLKIYIERYIKQAEPFVSNVIEQKTKTLSWESSEKKVRQSILIKHLSPKTEKSYLGWIKKFRKYVADKPPLALTTEDAKDYISHLAIQKKSFSIYTKPRL